MTPRGRRTKEYLELVGIIKNYRKPFGGPADPVNDLDPIQILFWPEEIGSVLSSLTVVITYSPSSCTSF